MAPTQLFLPGFGSVQGGFIARAWVTPPRFRRKKRRERWRRLRFEFQRRRLTENKNRVGGGGTWVPGAPGLPGSPWRYRCRHRCHYSVFMMDSGMEEDVTQPGTLSGCRCGPGFGIFGNWVGVPVDGGSLPGGLRFTWGWSLLRPECSGTWVSSQQQHYIRLHGVSSGVYSEEDV